MAKGKKKSQQKPQRPKSNGSNGPRLVSVPNAIISSMPKAFFRSKAASVPGAVRFEGCEVIRKITSQSLYTPLLGATSINPGNPKTFPRLSAPARAFECYSFKKLVYRFLPSCPTSTAGTLGMMIDYDPTDALAPNMVQFLANETAVAGAVYAPLAVQMDLKKLAYEKYFVRDNTVPSSSDAQIRQDNVGRFRMVADNGTTGLFVGYLLVEYDIELYNAKPPTPTSIAAQNGNAVAVAAGGNVAPPASNVLSDEGIVAGDSDAVTTTYTNAGGLTNTLDGLKSIYEAGTWLAEVYSSWTGAAITDVKENTPIVKKRRDSFIVIDEDEEKSGQLHVGKVQSRYLKAEDVALAAPLALGSGDVQIDLEVYNVTNPNTINPDFPASVVGMTLVDTVQLALSLGTGATVFPSSRLFTVPSNSLYMWRPKFTLGPTTGRTLNTMYAACNALSENDI